LIQERFKESYRNGVKFICDDVTIIFVSLEKEVQNKMLKFIRIIDF